MTRKNAYFDNIFTRFKVQLNLPGIWKVALVEFHATETSKKADEGLYIYADICKGDIVLGEERPLLRRLEKSSKGKWHYMLDPPFKLPISKTEARDIEVYIKGERDEDVTCLVKPVYLTLYFKHYPFW